MVEPSIGGAPAVAAQLARWEASSGLRVALVGHPDSPALQLEDAPFARIGLDLALGPRAPRATRALHRAIAASRVVHLHSSRAALLGRVANLGPRRPVVFTPHGWSWHVASPTVRNSFVAVERTLARQVSVLHALSTTEADEARRLLRLGDGRVELIPNGVDLDRFAPPPPGTERRPGPLRLLVVGRLCRQKGQDLLLDALARLAPLEPVELTFAGDGPAEQELRARAAVLPASITVTFLGAVADPAPHYRDADLVVLPSRWEGQSLALLEAIASGAATVATSASGTEQVPGVASCDATAASIASVVGAHLRDHRARQLLAADARRHREAVGEAPVRHRHLALKHRLLETA